jgi:hypothetical protein
MRGSIVPQAERYKELLSVPTHTRDSERGASDFRTGLAPVGPFVHLSSLPYIPFRKWFLGHHYFFSGLRGTATM